MTLSDFLRVIRAELAEFEAEQRRRQIEDATQNIEVTQLGWRRRLIKHLEGEES